MILRGFAWFTNVKHLLELVFKIKSLYLLLLLLFGWLLLLDHVEWRWEFPLRGQMQVLVRLLWVFVQWWISHTLASRRFATNLLRRLWGVIDGCRACIADCSLPLGLQQIQFSLRLEARHIVINLINICVVLLAARAIAVTRRLHLLSLVIRLYRVQ